MTAHPCKHGVQPALCVWCKIDERDAEIARLRLELHEEKEDHSIQHMKAVAFCSEKNELKAELTHLRAALAEREKDTAILNYWLESTGNTREGLLRIWGFNPQIDAAIEKESA